MYIISSLSLSKCICLYAWHISIFANTILPSIDLYIDSKPGIADAIGVFCLLNYRKSTVNRNRPVPALGTAKVGLVRFDIGLNRIASISRDSEQSIQITSL